MKYRSEKGFQLSLNIFRNDLSNMIVTDIIAYKKSGGQVYSYFNLSRALTEGIEVDMDRRFGKYFAVKAGYQYLYSADKDILEAIRKGEVFQRELGQGGVSRMRISDYGGLPNRSRHAANLKITYERPSGHFATIRTLYRSRWGNADADGNGLINRADEFANGFVQVNCSAGLPLGTSWKLMAGVDNIFNYKDIQFLPGNPGRMGYIDIQFNF
jgi:outer membrane receptor for ferrienterochelin and colicins